MSSLCLRIFNYLITQASICAVPATLTVTCMWKGFQICAIGINHCHQYLIYDCMYNCYAVIMINIMNNSNNNFGDAWKLQ